MSSEDASSSSSSSSVSEAPMSSAEDVCEWQPPPEWPVTGASPAVDQESADLVAARRADVDQMSRDSQATTANSELDAWERDREKRDAYVAATSAWIAKGGTCAQGAARRGPYNKKMPSPMGQVHPIEQARRIKEAREFNDMRYTDRRRVEGLELLRQGGVTVMGKDEVLQLVHDEWKKRATPVRDEQIAATREAYRSEVEKARVTCLVLEEFEQLAAKRAEEDKALAQAAAEATIQKLFEEGTKSTVQYSLNIDLMVIVAVAGAAATYAAYLYWAAQ